MIDPAAAGLEALGPDLLGWDRAEPGIEYQRAGFEGRDVHGAEAGGARESGGAYEAAGSCHGVEIGLADEQS